MVSGSTLDRVLPLQLLFYRQRLGIVIQCLVRLVEVIIQHPEAFQSFSISKGLFIL
jgi:hypothetical protein